MAQTHEKAHEAKKNETSPANTTTEKTEVSAALSSARDKRASEMSVAGKKDAEKTEKKAEKKPSWEPSKERERFLKMSDEKLLKAAEDTGNFRDKARATIFESTGNRTDHINGQDVSRSKIRAAVLEFLDNRPNKQAPANVICAYMHLTSGLAYPGKFDYGYLSTKDSEGGKRGMCARKLIKVVPTPAPTEGEAKTA